MHNCLTPPSATPIDTVPCASDNVCQILKGLSPGKGETRTAIDMLMDNVGAKDETEVDKQRSRIGAAVEERTKSNKVKETGIWIEPDKTELADDDLCTTEQVEVRHLGNHLSPIENDNFDGQEKFNSKIRLSGSHLSSIKNDNFDGQEKVNPDATLVAKPKGPHFIEDNGPGQEGHS